jgi:hypothetical protein
MSNKKSSWPIKAYKIWFNPKTHQGVAELQMDNDPPPDLRLEALTAQDVAALTIILTHGGATYYENGNIGISG